MIAQSQADFPVFQRHIRQLGRHFGAPAQTHGRTTIPFIKKYIVPALKRIGANLFEIVAPEIGEVVIGRKKLTTFAKDVGTRTVRKQLGDGKKKYKRRYGRTRSCSQKLDQKTVALAKIFFTI